MPQSIYLLRTAKPKQPHQILEDGPVCYRDSRTTDMVIVTTNTDANERNFTFAVVSYYGGA